MVLQFFWKRQGFPYQPWNSLSQCEIEAFNMACFPTIFSNRAMSCRREDFIVWRPKICIINSTLSVYWWQWFPQALSTDAVTTPNMYSYNLFRILVKREPNPLFVIFWSHKRPHFITLQRQRAFVFWHFNLFRRFFIFFINIFLQPGFRDVGDPWDTGYWNLFQ